MTSSPRVSRKSTKARPGERVAADHEKFFCHDDSSFPPVRQASAKQNLAGKISINRRSCNPIHFIHCVGISVTVSVTRSGERAGALNDFPPVVETLVAVAVNIGVTTGRQQVPATNQNGGLHIRRRANDLSCGRTGKSSCPTVIRAAEWGLEPATIPINLIYVNQGCLQGQDVQH